MKIIMRKKHLMKKISSYCKTKLSLLPKDIAVLQENISYTKHLVSTRRPLIKNYRNISSYNEKKKHTEKTAHYHEKTSCILTCMYLLSPCFEKSHCYRKIFQLFITCKHLIVESILLFWWKGCSHVETFWKQGNNSLLDGNILLLWENVFLQEENILLLWDKNLLATRECYYDKTSWYYEISVYCKKISCFCERTLLLQVVAMR